jgi:FkbM family methyltransferase
MKKIKSLVKKILSKYGFNQGKITTVKYEIMYLLLFGLQSNNTKIIQIGANDGDDLLKKFNNDFKDKISYIGVEPQETPFEKLKKNYQGFKNFNLIQGCVGKKGKFKFYYLNDNYKEYCKKNNLKFGDGTSSLIKENLSRRLIKNNLNPETYINKFDLDVFPLEELLKNNNIELNNFKDIDLLQIDAEGYDDEVIYASNIDFFRPKYINFEYKNMTKEKLDSLIKFLNENSYECLIYQHNDCLAARKV